MHRHRFAAVALLLTLAWLTGCSADSSGTSGSSGGNSPKRIMVLTNGPGSYWDACREGVNAADKELKLADHGLRAVLEIGDGTPKGQIDKLRQYASQADVVAVGISVTDASNVAIADEMRKLVAKGVHVLALDADVDREKFRDARLAFIGTDNLAAGRELGKAIAGLRPDGGALVTFVGRTGSQNAIERRQGVIEGAGAKFKALDNMADETDRSRAKDNVRNAITNHKDLDVLVGIWSYNGPAIVDVVQELNRRKDFTCVTFDAEQKTIAAMDAGSVDCMIVQNPFKIGYDGVKMMAALLKKDEATQKEMFPDLKAPNGDLYDTGLKLVVPSDQSPLKADRFSNKTEFLTLEQFKAWLAKYKLKES
jgi:ribose transport system substrate-binding protein